MGWIITLVILFLLAILPLGVDVRYNSDGPLVKVVAGPLKIKVFPLPKKEKKEKKKKKTAEEPPKEEPPKEEFPKKPAPKEKPLPQPPQPPKPAKPPKKESGGSLLDFLPLVKLALNLLGDFRRKLRLNALELKLIMAADDPCDLAVNYGRAWAAVGNLMPQLERLFVIKKRHVEVECDFTASETLVIAHLDITITLGRILALVAVYGVRAVIEFLNIRKKRKGGAVK